MSPEVPHLTQVLTELLDWHASVAFAIDTMLAQVFKNKFSDFRSDIWSALEQITEALIMRSD
eukprot:6035820-Amphidinium_carterae.1